MNRKILAETVLFRDLSPEETDEVLRFLDATERSYPRGSTLHRTGEPLRRFGLVLSGTVHVLSYDYNGDPMLMATVTAGGTFGESVCFLGLDPGLFIRAATDCSVLWLDPERLHRSDVPSPLLTERFTSMIAGRTLSMNDRIQVLSKIGIREKLVTFFSQCARNAGGLTFTVPFNREMMAVYLGVNRSALSRELSRMRDEGLIEFERNRFRLIPKKQGISLSDRMTDGLFSKRSE